MDKKGSIERIADETGLSKIYIAMLVSMALDRNNLGEFIIDYDDDGVYMMDIATDINHYNIRPVPYIQFVKNLERTIKKAA